MLVKLRGNLMKLSALKSLYVAYFMTTAMVTLGLFFAAYKHFITKTEALAWFLIYFAGTLLVSIPFMVQWWRQVDEAAREAHKSGWLWGGSLTLIPILFLSAADTYYNGAIISKLLAAYDLRNLGFSTGVLMTIMLMSCGYLGAWVHWWLKRR